jgi:hypothetical protein
MLYFLRNHGHLFERPRSPSPLDQEHSSEESFPHSPAKINSPSKEQSHSKVSLSPPKEQSHSKVSLSPPKEQSPSKASPSPPKEQSPSKASPSRRLQAATIDPLTASDEEQEKKATVKTRIFV